MSRQLKKKKQTIKDLVKRHGPIKEYFIESRLLTRTGRTYWAFIFINGMTVIIPDREFDKRGRQSFVMGR